MLTAKRALAEEIEFRRHMTRLAEQRRQLPPGPAIPRHTFFEDANGSELGLIDLFGNHDALVAYFWMYGSAARAALPDVHQLARRRERQCH